jgi:YHS domain-containing protein
VKEFKKKKSAEEISVRRSRINKTCPITGKDVNPTKTVEYEKQLIGFCCDDCKGKFESDPKKYIGKVKEFKKKKSAEEISFDDPINKKCPHHGQGRRLGQDVRVREAADRLLLPGLRRQVRVDPKKYIGKVKEFKKKSSKSADEEISLRRPDQQEVPDHRQGHRLGQDVRVREAADRLLLPGLRRQVRGGSEEVHRQGEGFKKKARSRLKKSPSTIRSTRSARSPARTSFSGKTSEYEKQLIGFCCATASASSSPTRRSTSAR